LPWNGSGTFNRIYSWVADKAAGLDISSSRMDTDTDDIASNGFGNCITRDGQGQPTANLPMANFRHTGVQNAVNRSDYAAFGQVQDGLPNWTIAGGSSDALTATLTPALLTLNDGQLVFLRAAAANVTTTPTFAPNGLAAETITKQGGQPLGIGDIPGNLAEIILRYNLANTRWELLNPSGNYLVNGTLTTGAVVLTLASSAPSGWIMFNDSTMGSASSGASSASAANQALFDILFASPFTDTTCPLLTSTGSATTRAGQGSAAAAWAANCRMTLPLTLGRALAVAGAGSGLTSFSLGQTTGANSTTLTALQIPTITSQNTNTVGITSTSTPNNVMTGSASVGSQAGTGAAITVNGGPVASGTIGSTGSLNANSLTIQSNNTGPGAHTNMQPTSFMNAMVKL
jgi:hypothetical protein